ncbi:MAG TPA: Cro/Cl family transcriptional regulator [Planctomycetaceae bacterium]|nr:Cro/Cl family transcriptional regulator [Planctomycetaceae bacterium]
MTPLDYLHGRPIPEQLEICREWGTTPGYVRKRCSLGQAFGPAICVAMEKSTGGALARKHLRPDDWHLIWPELAEAANYGHEEVSPSVR